MKSRHWHGCDSCGIIRFNTCTLCSQNLAKVRQKLKLFLKVVINILHLPEPRLLAHLVLDEVEPVSTFSTSNFSAEVNRTLNSTTTVQMRSKACTLLLQRSQAQIAQADQCKSFISIGQY